MSGRDKNSGRDTNFTITKDGTISTPSSSLTSYQYKYIDFAKTEILLLENQLTGDSAKDIKNVMLGKNAIIVMKTVEDTDGINKDLLLSDAQKEMYRNMPCGIQTSQGSIVSIPVVPGQGYEKVKNGLNITGQTVSGGNNWDVLQGSNVKATKYGYRTPDQYITNKNCRIAPKGGGEDTIVIQDRKYRLKNVQGSFVLCYDIGASNNVGQGSTKVEQQKQPQLQLEVGLKSQGSNLGKSLKISIPPTGVIKAELGKQVVTGAMSAPDSDFLPPQCNKSAMGGSPTKPLFIYPIYGGIIITNCIGKNMQEGGNEMFIPFAENSIPTQNIVIKNLQDYEEGPLGDIKGFITAGKGEQKGSQFKWIPAVHQQVSSLKLQITREKAVEFYASGDAITLTWIKSLGNFAYCPLFFHDKLQLDLYFKGAYLKDTDNPSNAKYTYTLYPLAIKNGDVQDDEASCPSQKASEFYNDTELNQTIYKSTIKYKLLSYTRYPMQIFGAIVTTKIENSPFLIENSNGGFEFTCSFNTDVTSITKWEELITNCRISCTLQGVTGSITLDSYPINNSMDSSILSYDVGELCLEVDGNSLFKGLALQVSKNNSDNNYSYEINLIGMQHKLEDMKLICAPFWDGDQLQSICVYMQAYTGVCINMINHSGTYSGAIQAKNQTGGNWLSSQQRLVGSSYISKYFRVPRSMNWQSPAVDFATGTSCLQALKDLAVKTSCFFTVGLDGEGYYYELNRYGIPYYVKNQQNPKIFALQDIINFSLQPVLTNQYNSIVTFGFLQKRFSNGKVDTSQIKGSVIPGSYYTKIPESQQGNIKIPWSKIQVSVEQGFLTKSELLTSHINRLAFSVSSISQGSVTVLGNTEVNHVYQAISIGGVKFFVISIQHNLDVSSKVWTTTYGIQNFTEGQITGV